MKVRKMRTADFLLGVDAGEAEAKRQFAVFLEEQAAKLVKAAKTHYCVCGEYAEEVAAALRAKAREKEARG